MHHLQLATSKLQVCLSKGNKARCMEQAQVSDTLMLYKTSPLGNTLTYKLDCKMLWKRPIFSLRKKVSGIHTLSESVIVR